MKIIKKILSTIADGIEFLCDFFGPGFFSDTVDLMIHDKEFRSRALMPTIQLFVSTVVLILSVIVLLRTR